MNAQEIIQRLDGASEFVAWHQKHPHDILTHIFVQKDDVQVGFYSKEQGTMTTFVVGEVVKVLPDQEILKSDDEVQGLVLSKVVLSFDDALKGAAELLKKEYSSEFQTQSFSILQTHDGEPIFNITFFTMSFSTINAKISAETGELLNHSIAKLADFIKQ